MTTMTKIPGAIPVAPWQGGKRILHKAIIERIEAIPHKTYVEPFVGMGGVFLRRTMRPRLEVANDLNGEITNLFRILQRHYPQLLEVMRFQITSRSAFECLRETQPETLTDLERAARFLYMQKLAFGGQVAGVFGVSKTTGPRFSLAKLEPVLDAVHERVDGVIFESLPWQQVVTRYDYDDALFYLDPPYWGNENDYGKGMFGRDEFAEMATAMKAIKGAFIMSINDRPEIRELFASFSLEPVQLKYSTARSGPTEAKELIISNRVFDHSKNPKDGG